MVIRVNTSPNSFLQIPEASQHTRLRDPMTLYIWSLRQARESNIGCKGRNLARAKLRLKINQLPAHLRQQVPEGRPGLLHHQGCTKLASPVQCGRPPPFPSLQQQRAGLALGYTSWAMLMLIFTAGECEEDEFLELQAITQNYDKVKAN